MTFFTMAADWLADHWVDVLSAVGGACYVMYARRSPRRRGSRFITKDTGLDYFAGLAIAPRALLFVAAFSTTIMTKLLESSRITLAGASVLAILAILQEDEVKPQNGRPGRSGARP